MQGRIIKLVSNDYTVLSNSKLYVCKSRGKFRNMKLSPLVGDYVIFDEVNCYILEIQKRRNELERPPISNIDQAFIITSVKNPDFSSNLLDKLLTIIEFHSIQPIICFTKMDLIGTEMDDIIAYYQKIGYPVLLNTQLEQIKAYFKDRTSVFTGQSGAGKSTLLNQIDSHLQLKTDEISYALGRGKHTTRHVELLPIALGYVADTPGFSAIHFADMTKEDIRDQFSEFHQYREQCAYRDCMHLSETDCEIKRRVRSGDILKSRYENYVNFIEKKENDRNESSRFYPKSKR